MDIKTLDSGYQGQGSDRYSSTDVTVQRATEDIKAADIAVNDVNKNSKALATEQVDPRNQNADKKAASQQQIADAVDDINKHAYGTEAIFGIHDKTNHVTIKIIDKKTRQVIKEYPPEKTLDLIAKVWEMAGILVDEKR